MDDHDEMKNNVSDDLNMDNSDDTLQNRENSTDSSPSNDSIEEDADNSNSTNNNLANMRTYNRNGGLNRLARGTDKFNNRLNNASNRLNNAGDRLNKYSDKKSDTRRGRAAGTIGNKVGAAGKKLNSAASKVSSFNDKMQTANNIKNVANDMSVAKDMAADAAKTAVKKRVMLWGASILSGGCLPIFLIIMCVAVFGGVVVAILNGFDGGDDSSATNFGTCSYNVDGKEVSDIKVRLLNCEGYTPVEGEELIDFETYITGVVYQEVGDSSYEALKAQAVASRSFALRRSGIMGGGFGVSLKQENGQWILSLRSCTNDQVFCNPDKGCWSNRKGGQTSNSNPGDWPNCTVHSGYDSSKTWSRGPLSKDSNIRKAVEETKGEVLVDKNNKIVNTDFTNTNQTKWQELAKQGKDYFEILISDYGIGNKISSPNCTSSDENISDEISASNAELINLSQREAWKTLIGKDTTGNHPYISKNDMDKRIKIIEVPMRVYASSSGYKTKKVTAKLSVNTALQNFWKSFFTDVYNNAPNFVFNQGSTYCYSYRQRTGGGSLSGHSYGTACDINPEVKGNEYGGHIYTESEWNKLPKSRSKYQILYKNSPIIKIAHKYTLSWGGEWNSTTDGMHLSFIGDESRETLRTKYK